jgi:DNA polymerase
MYCTDDFLILTLPSGRAIYYYQPSIEKKQMDWGVVDSFSYMGIDQKATSQRWKRLYVSPGSIAENITQAVARDILYHGMERMREMRLPIIGHVHDETITEVPEHAAEAALAAQIQCMTTYPSWADRRLFLGAEGFVTKRYRKD